MVDHDGEIPVALAVGDLVDADPVQVRQPVGAGLGLGCNARRRFPDRVPIISPVLDAWHVIPSQGSHRCNPRCTFEAIGNGNDVSLEASGLESKAENNMLPSRVAARE